jgi:hypothetical protein
MSMWEPFTERARRGIVLAQEEAQRLGNNYIGTEHILLGIISERDNIASKTLTSLGVTLEKVRVEVEAIVGRGGQTVQQEMVFTPRAKYALKLANQAAAELGASYIGTEHLLLGLMREGEGVAARVFKNLGVGSAKVQESILALLGTTSRKPITHHVKCWPQYFQATSDGAKSFDVRLNDRDYRVGDTLALEEYEPGKTDHVRGIMAGYTGRDLTVPIVYVLRGGQLGIADDFCVLGLGVNLTDAKPQKTGETFDSERARRIQLDLLRDIREASTAQQLRLKSLDATFDEVTLAHAIALTIARETSGAV